MDIVTFALCKKYTNEKIGEIEVGGLQADVVFDYDSTTGILKLDLVSQVSGEVLSTTQETLPTGEILVSGAFDALNQRLTFTKYNGDFLYVDLFQMLTNKQDKLPTPSQYNTFLHVNALGQFDWLPVEGVGNPYFKDIQGNPTDNDALELALLAKANQTDMDTVNTTLLTKQDTITSSNKLDYSLLSNTPSIPTKTSDLTNDSNFATTSDLPTKTSDLTNDGDGTNAFLTAHQDISGKENTSNKVSSWQATPDNDHYPTEKLVKDSIIDNVFWCVYPTSGQPGTGTTWQEMKDAHDANKIILLKYSYNNGEHILSIDRMSLGSSKSAVFIGFWGNTQYQIQYDYNASWDNPQQKDWMWGPLTTRIMEVTSARVSTINASSSDQQYPTAKAVYTSLGTKQDTLVSGTNIKTINNISLLGSGNIEIQGGGVGPQVAIFTASLNADFTIASLGNETTYANVQTALLNDNYPVLKLTKQTEGGHNLTFYAPFCVESYNPNFDPADQYYEFNTFLRVPDFTVLHFFLAHPDNVNTYTHTALFTTLSQADYIKLKKLANAMTYSNNDADLDINLNIRANTIDVD